MEGEGKGTEEGSGKASTEFEFGFPEGGGGVGGSSILSFIVGKTNRSPVAGPIKGRLSVNMSAR